MHKLRCFGLGLSSTSTGIFIYIYNLNMAFTFDIVLLCPEHLYYMAFTISLVLPLFVWPFSAGCLGLLSITAF